MLSDREVAADTSPNNCDIWRDARSRLKMAFFSSTVATITPDLLALAAHSRLQRLKGSPSILSLGVDPSLGQCWTRWWQGSNWDGLLRRHCYHLDAAGTSTKQTPVFCVASFHRYFPARNLVEIDQS